MIPAQQQGLGSPTAPQQTQGQPAAQTPSPYSDGYGKINPALAQMTDRLTGDDQLKLAQAEEMGVNAGKLQKEAEILASLNMIPGNRPALPQQGRGLV